MRSGSVTIKDVEAWNDTFAREHDIDAYYTEASVLVRWVTQNRLQRIRRMIDAIPSDRILEVGCGGGHILRMFPENELTGVDVSGEMIAKASRNLRGLDVTLRRGELHEVDLPPKRLDRIICSEVLEHVVDPASVIAEMAKLLAPGGRIVITIPNDRWIDAIKAMIRKSGLSHIPPFRRISWGGDHYHLHAWTREEMIAGLGKHFRSIRAESGPVPGLPLYHAFACSA